MRVSINLDITSDADKERMLVHVRRRHCRVRTLERTRCEISTLCGVGVPSGGTITAVARNWPAQPDTICTGAVQPGDGSSVVPSHVRRAATSAVTAVVGTLFFFLPLGCDRRYISICDSCVLWLVGCGICMQSCVCVCCAYIHGGSPSSQRAFTFTRRTRRVNGNTYFGATGESGRSGQLLCS
jgi:hypothetical protein